MTQELIEKFFSVPTPCKFRLGNIRGRVEIQAGQDGVIQVTAVRHVDSGDAQNTRLELSQAEDGSVCVETHYDEPIGWLFFAHKPCKVDYTVRLPRRCVLQVSGVTNTASAQGLEGELSFSTVSGGLYLSDISGTLRVKSVSGKVNGTNLAGALSLETVSGNVRLDSCRFSSLEGSTVSAALEVHTPLEEGPYRFRSVSGDVRLAVPRGTACTLTSQSLSGKILCDLSFGHSPMQVGQRRVEVQGGGTKVRHSSISGDLRLFPSEELSSIILEEAETVPAPDAVDATIPERWEILDRIDRGELTAEEALKILAG